MLIADTIGRDIGKTIGKAIGKVNENKYESRQGWKDTYDIIDIDGISISFISSTIFCADRADTYHLFYSTSHHT